MNLGEARNQIDQIDSTVMRLLRERMELALRAGKLKDRIVDREREQEVIRRVRSYSQGVMRPEFSERLFNLIMEESRSLEKMSPRLMGFQGEHGAFGEAAIRKYDSGVVPIPCREFIDVFEGVAGNQIDLGMVPVENSLEGAVTQVNDLLIQTDLRIVGEIRIPINQCLLALPETDCREIRIVYSHPQALAQCRGFLQRDGIEARPYYDTAGAAKMLSRERPKAAAVIASSLCAELYNLKIIKENIQDHESNSTRFVVLAREGVAGGNKCSLIIGAEHRAGSLAAVLKIFADNHVNLTRIESRPHRSDPGNYLFLIDFQGSADDPLIQEILDRVRKATTIFTFLGSYRSSL
jgi:prephenate dehydratase/chorismate mutase